jgi:Putative amidoligase enzyme
MDFLPPNLSDATSSLPTRVDGGVRRVGVEIEFLGLSAREAAETLAHHLGGSADAEDPHAYRVRNTPLGDMLVETDLRYVHPQRHHQSRVRLGPWTAALLGTMVSPVVPRELVVAPIARSRLPEVDKMLPVLRAVGARGRGIILLDSLSLHFNIELPEADATTVVAYLKAFLILDPRLRQEIAQGSMRRTLALPPRYPEAYRRRVLGWDYWPNMSTLMSDYLAANPTRKRGLDLLPLFAHLDTKLIRSILPQEKIGPRLALHYRLPQTHLSAPDWSIMPDWRRWLAVENLAMNKAELRMRSKAALNLS